MIKRGATQEVAEAVAAKTVIQTCHQRRRHHWYDRVGRQRGVNTRDAVLGMSFDELSPAAIPSARHSPASTRISRRNTISDRGKAVAGRRRLPMFASRATMSDAKV